MLAIVADQKSFLPLKIQTPKRISPIENSGIATEEETIVKTNFGKKPTHENGSKSPLIPA